MGEFGCHGPNLQTAMLAAQQPPTLIRSKPSRRKHAGPSHGGAELRQRGAYPATVNGALRANRLPISCASPETAPRAIAK